MFFIKHYSFMFGQNYGKLYKHLHISHTKLTNNVNELEREGEREWERKRVRERGRRREKGGG